MAAEPGGCAPSRGFTVACFSKHSSWLMQEEELWNGWSAVGWRTRWNVWQPGTDGWTVDLSNQVWWEQWRCFWRIQPEDSCWCLVLISWRRPCWKSPYLPVNDSFPALSFPFEEIDRSVVNQPEIPGSTKLKKQQKRLQWELFKIDMWNWKFKTNQSNESAI